MRGEFLNTIWTLMRRELWESPIAFKWAPLGVAALIVLVTVFSLVIGARFDAEMGFTADALRLFSEQPLEERRLLVSGLLFAFSTLFFQLLVLVVLFYLAGSLYDDRRDRSILFWKSLPVSDGMTVLSKLLTACLLVPALFFVAIILTQLALLLIGSVYGLIAGINPITSFWLPASLPRLWGVTALGLLVHGLWLLPIYAWLLFCSSWAPRLPILIAIAIPTGVAVMQHAWSLMTSFSLPGVNLGAILLKRLGQSLLPMSADVQFGNQIAHTEFSESLFMSFGTVLGYLVRLDMWIGVAIALPLLLAAVWFRSRATDN